MTDSFFLDLARSDDDYFYADSVTRRTVQWPLALSWYAASGSTDPSVLLNDNPAEYLVYSGGVHSTSVMLNRLERIGGISLNVVSGSYVSVGVIVGETLNDPVPNFYGWPATTSGTALRTELYFPTKYEDLPPAPSELLVPLAGSGQFNIVFPEPVFNRSFTVIHSGLGEYAISQILPRRATGAFDLEVNAIKAYHVSADLIDTIALQVSESIVVSPDIPDKSITGAKILDGTISGVIITPGTITSNEIAAGTITGNKIAANTISGALMTAGTITFDKIASKTLTSEQIADASITGANIVAGTVSGVLITDSAITASKIAAGTITGDKIAANTISGVLITAGTITSDKLQVNQLDAIAANMGTLVVNSGVSIGTSGYLWAGAGSATSPQNGIKLYTQNNVSKLTAYGDSQPQLEISTSGSLFTYPSGFVTLNREGLTLTTTYSGVAIPDTTYSLTRAKLPLNSSVQTAGILKYKSQQGLLNSLLYTTNESNGAVYTAFQTGVVHSGSYPQQSSGDFIVAGNYSSLLLEAISPSGFSTISLTASGEQSDALFYADKSSFYGDVYYNAATDPVLTVGNVHGYGTASSTYTASTPDLGEVVGSIQVDADGIIPALYPRKSFVFIKRTDALEHEVVAAVNGEEILVKVPLIFDAYGVVLTRTSTFASTTAGATISWQQEVYNNGVSWTGSQITIPVTGFYTINLNYSTTTSVLQYAFLVVNSTTVGRLSNYYGVGTTWAHTITRRFSANDIFQITISGPQNTTVSVNASGSASESPILTLVKVG